MFMTLPAFLYSITQLTYGFDFCSKVLICKKKNIYVYIPYTRSVPLHRGNPIIYNQTPKSVTHSFAHAYTQLLIHFFPLAFPQEGNLILVWGCLAVCHNEGGQFPNVGFRWLPTPQGNLHICITHAPSHKAAF